MNFLAISAVVAFASVVSANENDCSWDYSSSSFCPSSSDSSSYCPSSSSSYCPSSSSSSYCPSSSSSSYCPSSSSSYCSSSSSVSNPKVCAAALQQIVVDPNTVAAAYFAPMEAAIRLQSPLWFNPTTQLQTAQSFAQQFGVGVYISDASGAVIYKSIPDSSNFDTFASGYRSWALNAGVTSRSDTGSTFFSFPIFNVFGEMLTISLSQVNSNLPLNQICVRKSKHSRRH